MRALTTAKVELGPPGGIGERIDDGRPPPSLVEGPPPEIGRIERDRAVAAERVALQDSADEVGERPERGHRPPVDVERGGGLATSG